MDMSNMDHSSMPTMDHSSMPTMDHSSSMGTMDMSSSAMPNMASTTSSANMGMTSMSSMPMDMSTMSMTFFNSHVTPLYSSMWTPANAGQYAGTCIFLIVLAVALRGLLAVKGWREQEWMDQEFNRRYVTVAGKLPKSERIEKDSDSKRMILTENGVEEEVMVVKKRSSDVRPWRLTVDPVRAVFDTVIAGVGYLLMLAVMTMNVGYFLSVIGGTFLGSLLIGRYTTSYSHSH